MSGYVVWGTLAAFGTLSLLWTLLGWLLPSGDGMVLVCMGVPDLGILSRWRWLRGLGVLRCPLVVITDSMPADAPEDVEICSREQFFSRLERENVGTYGAGTGNSSGRGQRCDLSEL